VKIAVIGCGGICQRVYAPILQSMPEQVTVRAVCDLNVENARRLAQHFFPQARAYSDASALLKAGPELDAVMVLTSERANAATTRLVLLESSLPVYQEKPPATTVAELKDLIAVESSRPGLVYTAFNRRHMPLFQQLTLPATGLVKVTGALTRLGRAIPEFPYTCVHLLDSIQFYSRSFFAGAEVAYHSKPTPSWHIEGCFENRAIAKLDFFPHGKSESEYLVFETGQERWEMHFPDSDGVAPKARLVHEKNGGEIETASSPSAPSLETMGYAPAFRDFLRRLHAGELADSPHRLSASLRTIEILQEMVRACA
jgi:virulence factor